MFSKRKWGPTRRATVFVLWLGVRRPVQRLHQPHQDPAPLRYNSLRSVPHRIGNSSPPTQPSEQPWPARAPTSSSCARSRGGRWPWPPSASWSPPAPPCASRSGSTPPSSAPASPCAAATGPGPSSPAPPTASAAPSPSASPPPASASCSSAAAPTSSPPSPTRSGPSTPRPRSAPSSSTSPATRSPPGSTRSRRASAASTSACSSTTPGSPTRTPATSTRWTRSSCGASSGSTSRASRGSPTPCSPAWSTGSAAPSSTSAPGLPRSCPPIRSTPSTPPPKRTSTSSQDASTSSTRARALMSNARCPCMWQQRWHQSGDLPFLCHLLTPMLVLLYATLAMSRGAHHTGHTLLCGSSSPFYQSHLWTARASACASRSARRGRLKMPRGKHNDDSYPIRKKGMLKMPRGKHSDDSYPCSLSRFSIFFMCNGPVLVAIVVVSSMVT